MVNKELISNIMEFINDNRDAIMYSISYENFLENYQHKLEMKEFWKEVDKEAQNE